MTNFTAFAFALCPMSLLVGLIGGIALLRLLDMRGPWEQGQRQARERGLNNNYLSRRPYPGQQFTVYRVPENKIASQTAEMLGWGWHFVFSTMADSTHLHDLRFVWIGGEE